MTSHRLLDNFRPLMAALARFSLPAANVNTTFRDAGIHYGRPEWSVLDQFRLGAIQLVRPSCSLARSLAQSVAKESQGRLSLARLVKLQLEMSVCYVCQLVVVADGQNGCKLANGRPRRSPTLFIAPPLQVMQSGRSSPHGGVSRDTALRDCHRAREARRQVDT